MFRKHLCTLIISVGLLAPMSFQMPVFAAGSSAIEVQENREQSYLAMCKDLSSGKWVTVPKDQQRDFYRFYVYHYAFGPTTDNLAYARTDGTNSSLKAVKPLDMETLTKFTINRFGSVAYPGNETRTMMETWQRIQSVLTYDLNYKTASYTSCLNDGRGVCWTYAQAFCTVMNDEGIPCRIVVGTLNGGMHEWCRAFIDGQWTELDPTGEVTPYLQTQYNTYVELGL